AAPPQRSTLSLHDALPVYGPLAFVVDQRHDGVVEADAVRLGRCLVSDDDAPSDTVLTHDDTPGQLDGDVPDDEHLSGVRGDQPRSEEHTSELQSLAYLVCR